MESPKILYEDPSLLVINKPSGMVVNAAQTVKEEPVEDWIARNFQFPISNDQLRRNGVVHRLDKETSGVLLIAKTPEVFEELQRQFKAREVEKTYVALLHGHVSPEEGTINSPLGRLPWNRERFGVLAGGREAETRYKVIKYFSPQHPTSHIPLLISYSLVEFYPKTGRTHQIRVHAKSIGHPVVADTFYAGRKTSRGDRKWCPRLFLHAAKIVFKHPVSGEKLAVEAALPEDLQGTLEKLEILNPKLETISKF